MRKLGWLLLAACAALIVVPFGVANRHMVPVTFDPFQRLESALSYEMPLSLLLFVTFMLGVLLGGFVTWRTQSRWRRTSRLRTREAYHWRSEAERLARERDERETQSRLVGAKAA